jgi:hypothetical protein
MAGRNYSAHMQNGLGGPVVRSSVVVAADSAV